MMNSQNPTQIHATGEATGFIPAPGDKGIADRSTRAISPAGALTVPQYVQRRIEENTVESLQEAVRLSPTNGLAIARLAMATLKQDSTQNPRRMAEADWASQDGRRH